MHVLKIALLTIAGLVICVGIYIFYLEPKRWLERKRSESMQALSAAKTPMELKAAVEYLGTLVTLTNGSWIAIRYRDKHAGGIQSIAIARDSDGRWFESHRHFCGILDHLDERWELELEIRAGNPDMISPNSVSSSSGQPDMEQLIPLFTATNLDAACKQLLVIGFREFKP